MQEFYKHNFRNSWPQKIESRKKLFLHTVANHRRHEANLWKLWPQNLTFERRTPPISCSNFACQISDFYVVHTSTYIPIRSLPETHRAYGSWSTQNLHWKLGQLTPSFGSILAVRIKRYFFRNTYFFFFFKMECWNFQHLFEIEFRETSQNFNSFSLFRQLLFSFFLLVV